jgi:Na+-driven multidrug efflux pump
MEIYNEVGMWWKLLIAVAVFILATFVPQWLYRDKETRKKFASRSWWSQASWYCLLFFCILLDGEFLSSGIVHCIAYCAVGTTAIFMISNTIEKISLRKGEWEIKADMKDKEGVKS